MARPMYLGYVQCVGSGFLFAFNCRRRRKSILEAIFQHPEKEEGKTHVSSSAHSTHLAFPRRSSVEPRGRKSVENKRKGLLFTHSESDFPFYFEGKNGRGRKRKKEKQKLFFFPLLLLSIFLSFFFPSPPIPVFKTISFFILSSSNSRF